jgi:hypothetical protein
MKRTTTILIGLFLMFFSNSAHSQQVIIIPAQQGPYEFGDTAEFIIEAGSEGATFRFISPELDSSWWNMELLVEHLVVESNLTESSSYDEVIDAVARYDKWSPMTNKALLNGRLHVTTLSLADLGSQQCGNQAKRTANEAFFLFDHLGISPPSMRLVDFTDLIYGGGHQYLEYHNGTQWIMIDTDESTSIMSVRNSLGNRVSTEELIEDPEMILNQHSITKHVDYMTRNDSLARTGHYNWLVPMFVNGVLYTPIESFEVDERDFIYTLPPHGKLESLATTTSLQVDASMFADQWIKETIEFLVTGNFSEVSSRMSELSDSSGISSGLLEELIWQRKLWPDSVSKFGPDLNGANFFSIELGEGDHLIPPNLIHGFEIVEGSSFYLNDDLKTGDMDPMEIYFPIGTNPSISPLPEEDLVYGESVNTPAGTKVEISFFWNPSLYGEFWKEGVTILLLEGSIVDPNLITSISPIDTDGVVSFYPNPTTGFVQLSESSRVKVYDMTSRVVFSSPKTSSLNLNLSPGHYVIEFNETTREKLIVN